MNNFEKYKDELIQSIKANENTCAFVQDKILKSYGLECGLTGIGCERCHLLQSIWLMDEYKEPEVDWSKVEVDTPILVADNEEGTWYKKHFARYENGEVYTWLHGGTSWSSNGCAKKYKYAKLAEEGEQEWRDIASQQGNTQTLMQFTTYHNEDE